MRSFPDLLTDDEKQNLLRDAEDLFRAIQKNDLGGFSDGNRPFYIMHAFKQVIETYGKRDVGLTWSNNELARAAEEEQSKGGV